MKDATFLLTWSAKCHGSGTASMQLMRHMCLKINSHSICLQAKFAGNKLISLDSKNLPGSSTVK